MCVACGVWQAKHLRQVSHINSHSRSPPSHLSPSPPPPRLHRIALPTKRHPTIAIRIVIAPSTAVCRRTSPISNTIPAAGERSPASPYRRIGYWHAWKTVANPLLPSRDGGLFTLTSPWPHKPRCGYRPQPRSPGCASRALIRLPRRPTSCSTHTHHTTMPCG